MTYQPPVLPPSGTNFAQFQAGGITAMLDRLIGLLVAQGPTLAPTAQPVIGASGTGGVLPPGSYFAVYTESNGIGETTASPGAGAALTAGQELTISFPALQAGNVSRNVYVGYPVAGRYFLAAQGITASSITFAGPLPVGGGEPPTTNSTALSTAKLSALRSPKQGNLQPVYKNLATLAEEWNSGRPIPTRDVSIKLGDAHIVFMALSQLIGESGVLMDANPGTLVLKPTPLNAAQQVRIWP